jgi:hypothetical protein
LRGKGKTVRTRILLAIAVLNVWWTVPGHAEEEGSLRFKGYYGGGIGVPVNSTAKFAGTGGVFQAGAGMNLTKHHSLEGEFMWEGLPPTPSSLVPVVNTAVVNPLIATQPTNSLLTANNLYGLTANYEFRMEGRVLGFYVTAGGGWYYRHTKLRNYAVPPGTTCEPVWDWYGYTCVNGSVSTSNSLVSYGVSSGGVNGGGGITMYVGHDGEYPIELYVEARYHYSPQGGRIPTKLVPVTLGFRW